MYFYVYNVMIVLVSTMLMTYTCYLTEKTKKNPNLLIRAMQTENRVRDRDFLKGKVRKMFDDEMKTHLEQLELIITETRGFVSF